MEQTGRLLTDSAQLGTAIAELRALGWLSDLAFSTSEDARTVTLGSLGTLEISPEDRLLIEAVTSIVDDSWTAFLDPLGPDARYTAFRRFHGEFGGPRLLIEGIRRDFAIERDFERDLLKQVSDAIADHSKLDTPLIVEGQSGTGKSIALARVVAKVRSDIGTPVLYGNGRIPQPEEISRFCENAERAGAQATLIVCDANRSVDGYDELLSGLRSRGRRVVVLGSQYRTGDNGLSQGYTRIEAPSALSGDEADRLAVLLKDFVEGEQTRKFDDHNFLAYLYRCLPASRPRIGSGLGAEARATELQLRGRGRRTQAVLPISQLHQQLIEKGVISEYQPIFNDRQIEALENEASPASRIIDLVMVSGSLDCPVPVSLLLRSVNDYERQMDSGFISELFGDLDLFRWESRDSQGAEWLVLPRLALEARLICNRRLGSSHREAVCLTELISLIRGGIDNEHELRFLLSLLQQIGREGPQGPRYKHAYVDFAKKLTEVRRKYNVIDASLMLQESAFRRGAVRENEVQDGEHFQLLDEARDAVQTALDEIAKGSLPASRRTRQNLLGERAAIYGFLTSDAMQRSDQSVDLWSTYQAAKVAVKHAVSSADNYYPHDVGLWTPARLFNSDRLSEPQRAELAADIYSTLDQVEPSTLPPTQRSRFESRRYLVGETLGDYLLTDLAYSELEGLDSTAGYFLRAKSYAPDLSKDHGDVFSEAERAKANQAADFLAERIQKIQVDERCLSLLLECRWIAEMGRRLLRGEREPLPAENIGEQILGIVRTLNQASGDSSQYRMRYLEGTLAWLARDYRAAGEIFRQLAYDTDNVYRGRIVKRHLLSKQDHTPSVFNGRIERQVGDRRWRLYVEEVQQSIDLIDSDFAREDIRYGRSLSGFAIAFSFIGPIADPIRHIA